MVGVARGERVRVGAPAHPRARHRQNVVRQRSAVQGARKDARTQASAGRRRHIAVHAVMLVCWVVRESVGKGGMQAETSRRRPARR